MVRLYCRKFLAACNIFREEISTSTVENLSIKLIKRKICWRTIAHRNKTTLKLFRSEIPIFNTKEKHCSYTFIFARNIMYKVSN